MNVQRNLQKSISHMIGTPASHSAVKEQVETE